MFRKSNFQKQKGSMTKTNWKGKCKQQQQNPEWTF